MIQSFNLTCVLLYGCYFRKRQQGKWFNVENLVSGVMRDAAIRMELQVRHCWTCCVSIFYADIFWKHNKATEQKCFTETRLGCLNDVLTLLWSMSCAFELWRSQKPWGDHGCVRKSVWGDFIKVLGDWLNFVTRNVWYTLAFLACLQSWQSPKWKNVF